MTKQELQEKYNLVMREIHDIEMTSDPLRRSRWRELRKIKIHYESLMASEEFKQFHKFA